MSRQIYRSRTNQVLYVQISTAIFNLNLRFTKNFKNTASKNKPDESHRYVFAIMIVKINRNTYKSTVFISIFLLYHIKIPLHLLRFQRVIKTFSLTFAFDYHRKYFLVYNALYIYK
jgi:hypothetical protein